MGTVVLHTRGSITMGLFNKTTTSRLNSVNQRHIPTDRSPCRKSNQHQPAARLGLSSRVSDWIWGYGGHINREQPCVDELVARSAVPAFLALAAYLVGSPCCLTPRHCRKERRCKPNDPCMACSSDLVHMTRSLDHLSYEILTTTNL
jgi:hypothetical protein